MKKTLQLILMCLFVMAGTQAQTAKNEGFGIYGFIGDHVTHAGLGEVKVKLMRPDSTVIDSMQVNPNMSISGLKPVWCFNIYQEGNYLLYFTHPGYEPKYVQVGVKNVGRREYIRKYPPVYLQRRMKERKLGEAVVTATKVKFYSKGDTLVFNADAFQLQEGSMLDALIRQLPGVELKDDGRIYVNGQYVESLLLNGEDFFKKDRSILLDNLPTYMVNTVQVYDKAGRLSEMMGRDAGDKQLVMDVKLKKQYNIGWIANFEAAGGTDERYLARLFALRFTDHSRLSFFGAMNNVNEFVKPGVGSEWIPSVGSGVTTTRHGGVDYLIDDRNKRFKLQGGAEVRHSDDTYDQRATSVNFLQGGDTYGRSDYHNRTCNVSLLSSHQMDFNWERVKLSLYPQLTFIRTRQDVSRQSGTFSTDPATSAMSAAVLDSLFSPGLDATLQAALLNRYRTATHYAGHTLSTGMNATAMINFKHNTDFLQIDASGNFGDDKFRQFTHTMYDYPQEAASDFRNEYTPTRARTYSYGARAYYWYYLGNNAFLVPYYDYGHNYARHNKELMRLDRLGGTWGETDTQPLGALPSVTGWAQQTLDGRNSLYTTARDDRHTLGLRLTRNPMGWNYWTVNMTLPVTFERNQLDYRRPAVVDTTLTRSEVYFRPIVTVKNTWLGRDTTNNNIRYTHEWTVNYSMNVNAQPFEYNVNYTDDSNPLAVTLGHPGLKKSWQHNVSTQYQWNNTVTQRLAGANLSFSATQNALAMGYVYNRQTGARTYRPDNVSGNWTAQGGLSFSTPLDAKRRLTLGLNTSATVNQNVDLIGIEGEYAARRSTVHNTYLQQGIKLDYRLQKYQFGVKANGTWTHATSRREDFNTINAADFSYGLTAQLELPAGFQLSTDLTVYSRRGYEEASMNTNDVVWNARLAKRFLKGRLSVMLDGFDMLGQLSSVRRSLNGQGRVETWYNTIPRYAMLHAIYKLNIQPRKK